MKLPPRLKEVTNDFSFFFSRLGWSYILLFMFVLLGGLADGLGIAVLIPLFKFILEGNAFLQIYPSTWPWFPAAIANMFDVKGISLRMEALLAMVFILFAIKGLFSFKGTKYLLNIRHRFMSGLRGELINRVCMLPYASFVGMQAGKIESLMNMEASRATMAFRTFNEALNYLVLSILYIVLATFSDYRISIFLVVSGLLTVLVYRHLFRLTKRFSLDISTANHGLAFKLNALLQHFKYLKASGRLFQFEREVLKAGSLIEKKEQLLGKYAAISGSIKEPLIILIVSALLLTNFHYFKGNGSFAFFSLLMFHRAFTHLLQFQSQWNIYLNFAGSIQQIRLFNASAREEKFPVGTEKFHFKDQLKIDNLGLKLKDQEIFNAFHLKIDKGSFVLIKGASGKGKTTLLNLLARLYSPDKGNITIDEVEITSFDIDLYRQKVAYITQENVVFEDTLFNNISFWDVANPENELRYIEAISKAGLTELLTLGEAKIKKESVSVGQAQRIAIARELYKDAEILLMDEITSSLDDANEQIILETLAQLKGNKTIIMVSHKDSVLPLVDVVIEI